MDCLTLIITNSKSGDLSEEYCDYVKLTNVHLDHALLIIDYAFKSGYEVLLRNAGKEEGA